MLGKNILVSDDSTFQHSGLSRNYHMSRLSGTNDQRPRSQDNVE